MAVKKDGSSFYYRFKPNKGYIFVEISSNSNKEKTTKTITFEQKKSLVIDN